MSDRNLDDIVADIREYVRKQVAAGFDLNAAIVQSVVDVFCDDAVESILRPIAERLTSEALMIHHRPNPIGPQLPTATGWMTPLPTSRDPGSLAVKTSVVAAPAGSPRSVLKSNWNRIKGHSFAAMRFITCRTPSPPRRVTGFICTTVRSRAPQRRRSPSAGRLSPRLQNEDWRRSGTGASKTAFASS